MADLNARFGDWYYVVDAADVADLTLSRDALIEDAPAEDPDADDAAGDGPALPALSAPGERPVTDPRPRLRGRATNRRRGNRR